MRVDPVKLEIFKNLFHAVAEEMGAALRRSRLAGSRPPAAAHFKRAPAYFEGRRLPTDFFVREQLQPGNRIVGPAVIAEYSATTVVPPGWRARLDPYENLLLEQLS